MKAIETEYKGYKFRSRLEARWAVFFDACGVEWEYEPEGYRLDDGMMYLPDFYLHGVDGRSGSDLYVEVKGQMTEKDAKKIQLFCELDEHSYGCKNPVLVVGNIPPGDCMSDIDNYISSVGYGEHWGVSFYNFATIDGDYFAAHPGVNNKGKFELFGDDSSYMYDRDVVGTERAYRLARQARFEFGETPIVRRRLR